MECNKFFKRFLYYFTRLIDLDIHLLLSQIYCSGTIRTAESEIIFPCIWWNTYNTENMLWITVVYLIQTCIQLCISFVQAYVELILRNFIHSLS